jgi:hypothetical protein
MDHQDNLARMVGCVQELVSRYREAGHEDVVLEQAVKWIFLSGRSLVRGNLPEQWEPEAIEQGLEPIVDIAGGVNNGSGPLRTKEEDIEFSGQVDDLANQGYADEPADLPSHSTGKSRGLLIDEKVLVFGQRRLGPQPFELGMKMPPEFLLLSGAPIRSKAPAVVESEFHQLASSAAIMAARP